MSDEGVQISKIKGYWYAKGYKREEKIKENEDDDDEPLNALDKIV